jgi:tetratricopeptide (TPR) repeat protein
MFRILKKLFGIATTFDDYVERGDWYDELGETKKAAKDYAHAARLKPDDPAILCKLGTALIGLDIERAIHFLDEAIRLDPTRAESWYQRGVAHQNNRHHAQAMIDWNKAISLDPDHEGAHALLATMKTVLSTHPENDETAFLEEALREMNEVIRVNPDRPHHYERRARLLRHLQREAEAESDEQKAVALRGGAFAETEPDENADREVEAPTTDDAPPTPSDRRSGWLSYRLHMFLVVFLGIFGTIAGFCGAIFLIWKYLPASPLSPLVFFACVFLGWLVPTAIMHLAVPARCEKCGGRASLEGERPKKYVCRRCRHVHKTAWTQPKRYG